MITYINGDLFTSPAAVLVNTVNTVGVMGKGIAREFKRIFPAMFSEYQALCEKGDLIIGSLFLYRTPHKSVLNFPTKQHWRSPSRVEYIEQGLRTFVDSYERLGIDSIAFPQLGCGNGELDWDTQVQPLMEHYLKQLPIRIYIHVIDRGQSVPEHRDPKWMKDWLNAEPESLPASEVWEDLVASVREYPHINGWDAEVSISQVVVPWASDSDDEDTAEEIILFKRGPERTQISREELLPIWRKLSTLGLVNEDDFPYAFQVSTAPLKDLLLRLDYIQRVTFVSPRMAREEFVPGLMLVPRQQTQQRQLTLLEV